MLKLPEPAVYTAAPLRNRLRVRLRARAEDVWALVGDHTRLPEYSAGIEKVSVADDGRARTCRFRATDDLPALDLTEQIRWQIPGVGYSTSAVQPNPFGLSDDLSVVTVHPDGAETVFEWNQYYEGTDLAAAVASFDEGLADIAERLVATYGGQITDRWTHEIR